MAKYRIVAMPPKYNLGGLFKKKNKEVIQSGAWAGANPQLVQPGQEGFDLPESQAAPNSEFAIQEMTPEQQAAYLKNARYQEALAAYKPNQSTYKDLARPQGNLVLAEDYEADPNKFTSAGYYPIKTESGNYEMIANKDIANLIYQKGISSQELSDKFNLGDSAELQKNFDPIYKDAAGIHAKRSKEKIDGLIKSGMSKDQAIASLVKQGEGDVQGLNSIYGEYTEDAYQRQKAEADKLTASSKQPGLNEQYEKFFAEQDEARAAEIEAMKNKIDYSGSLTPSETNINTANKSLGNFGRTGKDAYSANESLKAEVEGAYDIKSEEQKPRPVIRALLNSDLTEEQKKEYLSNPQAFEDLYNQHAQWAASPAQKQGEYMSASGRSLPDFSFKSDFKINPLTTSEIKLPAGLGQTSIFDRNKLPFYNEHTINVTNPLSTWTKARDLKKSVPSGRVDMLDKEWIMGALGLRVLPAAAEAATAVNAWAPLGSMAPNLTVGNALSAKSLYDAGTKYAPKAHDAFQKGQSEGWDSATTGDFAYNALKTGLSTIPLSSTLKNAKVVKKGKDAFSTVDETISAYKTPDNPEKYYKALKAVGSFIPKQKGGEITLELTDNQIQDYIKRGYEVMEVEEPKMQQGGTPSQLWYEYTGTPWSEARAKGLTDGSMEQNLALAKRIESGEFGKPKVSAQQSQNVSSGYDDMVANMVGQGQTLDQLVAARVGTREGLMYRFPDLFSKAPVVKSKTKTPQQLAAEQKAGKDWLIGKAKELGNEVMGSISNSFWGKAAKKVGQATLNYAIELEKKDRATKKKQEEAKIKKVEKEVKKEVKKVNPTAIQESLKTPSVQDVLQQAGVRYQSNPLKQFTEDKTQSDFGSNLMAQVQQNQQRFGPVQTSKPQQPIANGMGSNFAQGQNIQQVQARNKAMGTSGQNLPEIPGMSIGLKDWENTDFGNAYENLSDSYETLKKGIKRKLQTHGFVDDTDKKVEETEPQSVEKYYSNPYAKQNSFKVDGTDREFKQQLIPTSALKLGYRNRGDLNELNTDGIEITTFNPFTDNLTNASPNSGVLALDANGRLHAGSWNELKNNKGWKFSKTFMNKVVSIDDAAIDGTKSGNPGYVQPKTTVIDDNGNLKAGSLNVLYKPNKEDHYGSIQGGRILIQDPETKEVYLLSGSVSHIKSEFKRLKGNNKYMNVYTLDNGTYSRGLSYSDKKLTKDRLRSYDNENTSGGNGLYIMNYEKPVNKFDERIVKNMPNVRTKTDESYKKGHSLKNEIKNIVLHHTGHLNPKTAKDAIHKQYFKKGNNSSHVVIYKDGSREIFASPEQVTFHAGQSKWNNREDVNDFSVGIEFDGDTNKEPLTDLQIKSFVEYYAPIAKKYNVKLKDIITHQMIRESYIKSSSKNSKVELKEDIKNTEYSRILNYLKQNGYK